MNSLSLFFALQFADIISTVLCAQVGYGELNPLFHGWAALVIGKLFACLLAWCAVKYRRLSLRLPNLAYILVVGWNLFLFSVIGFANHVTHYKP